MSAQLGIDVGGTFTDVVLADGGDVTVAKVPSTPDDQADGVLVGVDEATGGDLGRVARFVHGSTVATNTVLERDGARTVLVTTAGFRDLLEIGRQDRPSLYDLGADRPLPVVAGDLVVEARERIGADGEVLIALTDDAVARVVAAVMDHRPEAVAISLLFSFLRPEHERRLAATLSDQLDEVPISRSSDVLPVFREYERTSTTALNAYVAPRMQRYLASLERRLRGAGLAGRVEVMRSGGGTSTADVAARYPVTTLLSGPAAGAWGAAAVGHAAGHDQLVAFDMGGTSTDVTLVLDGAPRTTADGAIDGLPFAVTTTDLHTIGSGGGSIAWQDRGGALRVGPRSAGADPGPACYGRGGTAPTVTDAHALLGRIPADGRLGGHLSLEVERAEAVISDLADDLGMSPRRTAEGILEVVEAQMVQALRVVSVERGHDPRTFTLLAFGGAGGLHQAALARELGSPRVLVPPHAGVLSALGLLAAPVTADAVRTHLLPLGDVRAGDLDAAWEALENEVRGRFADQDVEVRELARTADLRYRGQAFELEVDAPTAQPHALADVFHDTHRRRYGYAQLDEAIEVVNLRVRAHGPRPDLPLPERPAGEGAGHAQTGVQQVVVSGTERDCPVYAADRLGAGDRLRGPAIVAALDTTCFVAAWQEASMDRRGCMLLTEATP